jgi:hypothetical protein
MNPWGLLIVAAGAFACCGGWRDWDWFMDNRRARGFVILLGRQGARRAYVVLGAVLVVLGILVSTGAVHAPAKAAEQGGGTAPEDGNPSARSFTAAGWKSVASCRARSRADGPPSFVVNHERRARRAGDDRLGHAAEHEPR